MGLLLLDSESVEVVAPPAPTLPVASAFSAMVLRVDRAAQRLLGGQAVTYQPAAGFPVSITGIFDASFLLAHADAEAGVETKTPAVFLRLDDLPVDPEFDDPLLTIGGQIYRVTSRHPDDVGGIMLALRLNG